MCITKGAFTVADLHTLLLPFLFLNPRGFHCTGSSLSRKKTTVSVWAWSNALHCLYNCAFNLVIGTSPAPQWLLVNHLALTGSGVFHLGH